jgi:hypothetical protein
MKFITLKLLSFISCAAAIALTGCTTTGGGSGTASAGGSRFRATDGRVIEIGKATAEQGGRSFRNPHMDKCWVADDFNFSGYDTLYVAPVASTAKFNEDEVQPHKIAQERMPTEFATYLKTTGVFPNVVTSANDIKAGAKVLRLENTILEYRKGGGAARYWAGLYGAGQPILRVSGIAKDGDKQVFTYEMRRSGVSAGARMVGGFRTDVDIQAEDMRSMALDLSDFVAAIAGKYQAR